MNEQIWLTDAKYLWLSLNSSWVFCIDTCVYTISKVIGMNGENKYVCRAGNT